MNPPLGCPAGGLDYTADDLEQGVLRGNRAGASNLWNLLGLHGLAGGFWKNDNPRLAKVGAEPGWGLGAEGRAGGGGVCGVCGGRLKGRMAWSEARVHADLGSRDEVERRARVQCS